MTKAELRGIMKARLAGLDPEAFTGGGAEAAERLCAAELWDRCGQVLLFFTLPSEIDTAPLLDRAFAAGKEVFFPKTRGPEMDFFRVDCPGGAWPKGAWGIPEPPDTSPERLFRPAASPALIVTPGLAFDRRGNRLGRGRGYYDRFFARLDRAGARYHAAGFCLPPQVVEEVPAEAFDRRLDALCTSGELLRFQERRRQA
ncbi:MAG: 5-formyltetrahydrofolate cyclo-ligase [Spirochaetaceae bacterium]|nr:5-formyltetrahydrofolate cyclo-ligase [Spirochaetaceae bacterium]